MYSHIYTDDSNTKGTRAHTYIYLNIRLYLFMYIYTHIHRHTHTRIYIFFLAGRSGDAGTRLAEGWRAMRREP